MSDNEEMMQTKNSSLEDSSGDESSSEAAVNNQKFSSRDGEPVNKPRKESTSSTGSSSSSEDGDGPREIEDDSEEESSKSEACISKSVSKTEDSVSSAASEQPQQPDPQPRSRSVSVEEAPPAPASRKMSSKKSSVASKSSIAEDAGNTDDEVEEIREAAPAPVPVVRKVSAPVQPEIVIDEHEDELTKEEIVNSKRETVHLDEAQKAEVIAEVRKSSAASAASVSDSDSESEQAPAAREPEVPRKISSNSVQENASIEAKPATIIEDNSSASSSDTDENIKPSHNFRNESPEQNQENHELNGRRSTNGIDITKIYTQGMDNNNKKTINNNNNNVEKMGETRTKPTRDITQIYTQGVAKASPPASPRSMPRGRPASDITKLYTGKLDTGRSKTPDTADKPGPRKHNMSTAVDKDAIRQAYDDVRSDTKETEW